MAICCAPVLADYRRAARNRASLFDAAFVEMARSIYFVNDEREINEATGSPLVEEKRYQAYRRFDAALAQAR